MEIQLKNISSIPLPVHSLLDPEFGYFAIGITGPDGKKLPFVPLAHANMRIHITLRSVIGHYTSALAKLGKKSDAIDSQSKLIALYRKRGVISSATKEMEEELAKMK